MKGRKLAYLISVLTVLGACNSGKQLIKNKDLDKACEENLLWLFSVLEPYNGLLKVKVDNFETDTAFQNFVQIRYWNNMFDCWFETLDKEEVMKLYGKPNKVTIGRNEIKTYEYFIYSKDCPDTTYLNNYFHDCGVMRFEFDKNGNPKGGMLELTRIK